MRAVHVLPVVAILYGCSGVGPGGVVPAEVAGQSPVAPNHTPATLVYFPASDQLMSLESYLDSDVQTTISSTSVDNRALENPNAIDVPASDEQTNSENVGTSIFNLSRLKTRYPSWIFDSDPPAAEISGLSAVEHLRTPQKVINVPKDTVEKMVALKQGFHPCRFQKAQQERVFMEGIEWIRLICVLPTL